MNKADIGLIGLAVMGENLAMNMESKGFTVAVYNRSTEKVDRFIGGRAAGRNFIGCHSPQELVDALAKPRRIFMMVKAGAAVDSLIDQLLPLLEEGDILIDGGNSHYPDTIRRTAYVESKGMLYVGCGVSGGEEGALNGPSLMPGGSPAAWEHVRPILQAICAKVADGSPCCDWVGENGAGHFVKMVHNGIEYGDMQLICEAYQLMRDGLGLSSEGEYLDAAVEDGAEPAAMLAALKEATAEELPVYALRVLPEKTENAMAAVGGAIYRVDLPAEMPVKSAETALKAILDRESIILPKKTKTREIELDIRQMIFGANLCDGAVTMALAAGSRANLPPEMLLDLFAKESGVSSEQLKWQIRRMDLLDHEGRSLGSLGEETGWES